MSGPQPEPAGGPFLRMMPDPDRIMLPRLGYHFAAWGSGHTHSGPAHDGPCICECGIVQPYDQPTDHEDERDDYACYPEDA